MGDKMRIYVGGLGPNVQEDDLKKTFTSPQLGTVESVQIIRSKGRSFGYLDFLPASDKGLAKLFSSYNGCMWKGGRLKLEKAREHYMFRLRREWTVDAELETKLSSQNVHADESVPMLQQPKKDQDIEKLLLKIFFPKLRKIKPVPLKGTGKHKYSFQRIEIPPLPIHFCDCEEHSGPLESTKRNCTNDHEADTHGVNEDELNMMKSILNKFLAKDNCPNNYDAELAQETFADNRKVDDNEEDQVSDEDNLVINIVGQPGKRVSLFEDWGQKTTAANQDSLVREPESFNGPIPEMHGSKKGKLLPDKKRKLSVSENYSNDKVTTRKKARKGGPHDSIDDPVAVNTQQTDTGSGSSVASSHKSSWRDLVSEKEGTAFHISDILMDPNPEVEVKPRSNHLTAEPRYNENDSKEDPSSKGNELEKLSDKKRKLSVGKKAMKGGRCDNIDDPVAVNTQQTDTGSGSNVAISHKSAWRDLVSEEGTPSHISDILTDPSPEGEAKPRSDHLTAKPCCNENDGKEDQSSKDNELEKLSDVHSTKPREFYNKSARGAAWLQKSTWLQLVADTSKSTFNLAQILPGVTCEKQELHQFGGNDFSNSESGKQHRSVCKDQKSPVEDMSKPQRRTDNDIYAAPGNPTVDVLTEEQNHTGLDGEVSNSDSKQTVEEKDEGSAVPYNRAVGDIVISETCPFMRSAASMKEWVKTKAALSASHKKKGKGKESVQD